MTIQECFDYVDEIKPNAFSNETKTIWLNEVEGMVQTEIFLNAETDVFEYKYTFTENTPISFPDEHTIGISDKKLLMKFRPGGKIIRFAPGSIYGSVAEMDEWKSVSAIQNGEYYEVPFGPYNWMGFPPSVQRYLGMMWMAQLLYPETSGYNLYESVKEYYGLFYHCELTEEQYEELIANSIGVQLAAEAAA